MKKLLMVLYAILFIGTPALRAHEFYAEPGGKGMSISVSEPAGKNLSADEAELLPLMQKTLTGDFQKYAGMTVSGWQDTTFTGQYVLTGSITKTSGKYFLEFAIKDTSSGTQKANYGPKQCTLEELQSLKGIKTASEELIGGLGVRLTQAGKDTLLKTATNEAEAMNALAKGIALQRSGAEVAFLAAFMQAANFDPQLLEAAIRVSILSRDISSGNMGGEWAE